MAETIIFCLHMYAAAVHGSAPPNLLVSCNSKLGLLQQVTARAGWLHVPLRAAGAHWPSAQHSSSAHTD